MAAFLLLFRFIGIEKVVVKRVIAGIGQDEVE